MDNWPEIGNFIPLVYFLTHISISQRSDGARQPQFLCVKANFPRMHVRSFENATSFFQDNAVTMGLSRDGIEFEASLSDEERMLETTASVLYMSITSY